MIMWSLRNATTFLIQKSSAAACRIAFENVILLGCVIESLNVCPELPHRMLKVLNASLNDNSTLQRVPMVS